VRVRFAAGAARGFDRALLDAADPGMQPHLTFDPAEDIAAPFIGKGARPRVAILREQGVNSHLETAYAFDRAGFDARRRLHRVPAHRALCRAERRGDRASLSVAYTRASCICIWGCSVRRRVNR